MGEKIGDVQPKPLGENEGVNQHQPAISSEFHEIFQLHSAASDLLCLGPFSTGYTAIKHGFENHVASQDGMTCSIPHVWTNH